MPVAGIVLFWGAAIPGDIPRGGVPGDLSRYEAGDCLLGGSVPHRLGVRIARSITSVPSRVCPSQRADA